MNLTCAEKFLLLAKHPAKGGFIISDPHLGLGLAGAIILDMTLSGLITIDNKRVTLVDGKIEHTSVHSEIATKIRDSRRLHKIGHWINRINNRSGRYRWFFVESMANKEIMKVEEKRFLLFIPYKRSYLINERPRNELVNELRNSLFAKKYHDEEITSLLALVHACGLHKALSSNKAEIKTIKQELKTLIKENPIASGVESTIRQIQVAIATSIAVSAAVSASSR